MNDTKDVLKHLSEEEKEQIRERIRAWKDAEPLLEQDKREQIRNADTEAFIRFSAGFVDATLQWLSPRTTSGLIEQQAMFKKFSRW